MSDHNPFLIIVSAPSGCGKTTLLRILLNKFSGLNLSISHTTRPIRKGEVAGVDYFFVNIEKFNAMLKSGNFIESALVHDNYYGTSYASIDTLLSQGNDVILDIDVQGMHTLKSENKYDLVTIFIMPPDLDTLASRLQTRGTDSGKVIKQRLINAENEINAATDYDYLITNDDLDRAVSDLFSIITAERLRYFRRNSL